jgi:transposase-like protein
MTGLAGRRKTKTKTILFFASRMGKQVKTRETRRAWMVKEKEFVVLEALENEAKKERGEKHLSLHGLAKKYQIERKQIRDWVKKYGEGKFKGVKKTNKSVGSGRVAKYPEMEKELLVWIATKRDEGFGVPKGAIRVQALKIAVREDMKKLYEDIDTFKASKGWLERFMVRGGLSLRRRTTLAQRLPKDDAAKIQSFHKYIIDYRKNINNDLSTIGNMDETPMWFDMPAETTVEFMGMNERRVGDINERILIKIYRKQDSEDEVNRK